MHCDKIENEMGIYDSCLHRRIRWGGDHRERRHHDQLGDNRQRRQQRIENGVRFRPAP